MNVKRLTAAVLAAAALFVIATSSAFAATTSGKPNILFIVSDDTGYGDLGPYGGGEGRGMPTPNIDRMAADGMTFFSFYAQPSCTPGRAAMQTGRIPNRSGMTTVAFQGQGGGLPAAEWTLASVLKQGGYQTYFTGKWHLGEADYALPNAQGYDVMKYVGLYHLNAYTYADPTWFPDMDPELRAMFQKVTKGALSGKAGEKPAKEDFKINGAVRRHARDRRQGRRGRHSLLRRLRREGGARVSRRQRRRSDKPFFINVNFMKVHQPNMPAPEFEPQVDVEIEVRRLGGRTRHAHRPHHGQAARARSRQEHARRLHDRQRRLAGRVSRRRLHAVPRHEGHRARRRQPRSRDRDLAGQDQGRTVEEPRHRRRPRPDGDVRVGRPASSCRRKIAKASRSSSTATT